ncbi:MAG: DUF2191 domain-containing protein [Leptospirales bacterium]
MKVTALIPDDIVNEVKSYSGGKNITDSITIALKDWLKIQKIKNLNTKIEQKPLEFANDYSADNVRSISRKKN